MNVQAATPHPTLWTIGHSTRSQEEFLALLNTHKIALLIDVRRYPGSRRYPHFHSDALEKNLADTGLVYRHLPDLGGRRTARSNSPNDGWKNASFRGYADYMHTEEFEEALEELVTYSTTLRTAIMCAEAVPWRCHRSLIADALVTHGWEVIHILGPGRVKRHQLTAFARLEVDRLLYPAPADQDVSPRLF